MPIDNPILFAAALAAGMWLLVLMLPWQPWRNREVLDSEPTSSTHDLTSITVLIPARNEATVIGRTLQALAHQGEGIRVILVDDHSNDGTAAIARHAKIPHLTVISADPLPPGWTGKLSALEQGRQLVSTPYTLLLDADIELAPGLLSTLYAKSQTEGRPFLSLLAVPSLQNRWERLLMPAFVFFFKQLYPFALANRPGHFLAAAAGGCILLETRILQDIGGFKTLHNALIDDCTLATRAKRAGYNTWIGLTHSARSLRPYPDLGAIWHMVARTAFTQLRYSIALLLLCTVLMLVLFAAPVISVLLPSADVGTRITGLLAYVAMLCAYWPTLRFYGRPAAWALTLPLTGLMFLAMTWTSAIRYWRGRRSQWKGRIYEREQIGQTRRR